jgi:NAD(P)H-dependent flavin oxidoreductase YrpB (nitropropane dioxygenase family)
MNIFKSLAATAILGAFTGCASVGVESMTKETHPAVSVESVEVFYSKRPDRPYEEIAMLHYRANPSQLYTSVLQLMREKAAAIGADGVIMVNSSAGPTHIFRAPGTLNSYGNTKTNYTAVSIKYK